MTPQERLDRLEKHVAYQIDENRKVFKKMDELLTRIDDLSMRMQKLDSDNRIFEKVDSLRDKVNKFILEHDFDPRN